MGCSNKDAAAERGKKIDGGLAVTFSESIGKVGSPPSITTPFRTDLNMLISKRFSQVRS